MRYLPRKQTKSPCETSMKYEIKNRWTDEVLFTCEVPEGMESGMIARYTVETAIAESANLEDANLRGANLYCANLHGANLEDANLRDANLHFANLEDANLLDANLLDANLCSANLENANLENANLENANLRGANLHGANLHGANLRGAKNSPLVINGLNWDVQINGTGMMRIGCQNHSIEDWKSFTDEQISQMASDALEFWNQHKSMLLGVCDSYKHTEEN